jgi:RNA recognition motif. (a.k.a. RRM, RBD, or RNP domain)
VLNVLACFFYCALHCTAQRYSLAIRGRQVEVLPAVRGDFYAAVTQRLDAQDSELLNLELELEAAAAAAQAAAAAAKQQQQQQQPITAVRPAAPRSPAVSPIAPAAVHYQQQQQQQQHERQQPLARQSSPQRQQHAAPTAASVVIAGLAAAAPSPPLPAQTHASVVRRSPARTAAAVAASNGRQKGSLPLASPPKAPAESSTASSTTAAAAATAGDDHLATVAAAGKSDSKGSNCSSVIRMRGLPYRASKAEVAAFFKGCALADDGVILVARSDGKATGEAYVHFASREDMRTALRKDREMLGNRYIELFASSAEEMQRYCTAAAR